MKKRKYEIIIVIAVSLVIWIYFSQKSIPLNRNETILVVGIVMIIVTFLSWLIKKLKRNEKQD